MSRRVNWPLWSGFILSVAAFVSYFAFFIRFPVMRDVPWLTFFLFAASILLLIIGLRRASARRPLAWIVTILGTLIAAFFCFSIVAGRQLPASAGAPGLGAKAPDFVLLDTNRKPVGLQQLLTASGSRGVILIFYRGYW
jgi:hypothetical protein